MAFRKIVENIHSQFTTILHGNKAEKEDFHHYEISEIERAVLTVFSSLLQVEKEIAANAVKHTLDYLEKHFGKNKFRKKVFDKTLQKDALPYLRIACRHLTKSINSEAIHDILLHLYYIAHDHYFLSAKKIKRISQIAGYLGIEKNKQQEIQQRAFAAMHISKDFIFDPEDTFEINLKKYKKLILKYHPDKNSANENAAHEKFIALQQAFENFKTTYYPTV